MIRRGQPLRKNCITITGWNTIISNKSVPTRSDNAIIPINNALASNTQTTAVATNLEHNDMTAMDCYVEGAFRGRRRTGCHAGQALDLRGAVAAPQRALQRDGHGTERNIELVKAAVK